MSKLKEKYTKEIVPQIMKNNGYKNPMRVPRIEKIVINRGVGETKENPKAIDVAGKELAEITGQKPLVINSKKAIAAFKLRADLPIGLKVTLRGLRMYQFLERLINISLPKIRDFRGINPNAFDGRGNYTLGVHEQLIFPEVEYEKVDKVRGMDITFVTSTQSDQEAKELLTVLGMPFAAGSKVEKEKKA